jgi:hypothetical protein
VTVGQGGGGGGGFDGVHNDLSGRSTSNAHPASAISGLAAVATTGVYSDLSGRPTLGTAAAADTTAFATSAQGSLAATAVQPGSLAAVATTGQYSDLSGRPTLAAVATTGQYSDLSGRPTLAQVATSGQYSDLIGAPAAYSDEQARDAIGAALVAGTGVSITVSDPSDTITVAVTTVDGGTFT